MPEAWPVQFRQDLTQYRLFLEPALFIPKRFTVSYDNQLHLDGYRHTIFQHPNTFLIIVLTDLLSSIPQSTRCRTKPRNFRSANLPAFFATADYRPLMSR